MIHSFPVTVWSSYPICRHFPDGVPGGLHDSAIEPLDIGKEYLAVFGECLEGRIVVVAHQTVLPHHAGNEDRCKLLFGFRCVTWPAFFHRHPPHGSEWVCRSQKPIVLYRPASTDTLTLIKFRQFRGKGCEETGKGAWMPARVCGQVQDRPTLTLDRSKGGRSPLEPASGQGWLASRPSIRSHPPQNHHGGAGW